MTIYCNSEGVTWRSVALSNGVSQEAFYARISRGMDPERAATKPVQPYFKEWNPRKKKRLPTGASAPIVKSSRGNEPRQAGEYKK